MRAHGQGISMTDGLRRGVSIVASVYDAFGRAFISICFRLSEDSSS